MDDFLNWRMRFACCLLNGMYEECRLDIIYQFMDVIVEMWRVMRLSKVAAEVMIERSHWPTTSLAPLYRSTIPDSKI